MSLPENDYICDMKTKTLLYTILAYIILLTSPQLVHSQEEFSTSYTHKYHLDITQGLTHNGVTSMHYDSRGYLWVGTYDGLCAYDGSKLTAYKNNIHPTHFQSNRIRSILETPQGHLWLGTDEGITVFDYDHAQFTQLSREGIKRHNSDFIIRKLFMADNNQIVVCVSENDGVLLYTPAHKLIRQDYTEERLKIQHASTYDADHYLLATTQGLYLYNWHTGTFQRQLPKRIGFTYCALRLDNKHILVAMRKGLHIIRIAKQKRTATLRLKGSRILKDIRVRTLAKDIAGGLWIGTFNQGFQYYPDFINQPNSWYKGLPYSRISNFLFDQTQHLWVSTFDGGLHAYTPKHRIFQIHTRPSFKNPDVYQLSKDHLIVRSQSKLTCYSLSSLRDVPLPFALTDKQREASKSVLIDRNGTCWMFFPSKFNTGIAQVVNKKIQFVQHPFSEKLPQEAPLSCIEDMQGNIWLSYTKSLVRIVLDKKRHIQNIESIYEHRLFDYKKIAKVMCMYPDSIGQCVWIGTNTQGLYKIKLDGTKTLRNTTIKHYVHDINDAHSLSNDFVSAITRSPQGTLWIGTEQGGLCQVHEKDDKLLFKTYSEADGLSNNVVKSLLCDDNGDLWIATNIGLNVYRHKTKRFHIYHTQDGLPYEEFWYRGLVTKDKQLVFALTNGICHFSPEQLPESEPLPKLHIKNLKIYNAIVAPNTKFNNRVILKHRPKDGDHITLKYNENVFAFQIDALYSKQGSNHKIQYMLEPFNMEWISIPSSQHELDFHGLQPGDYTLKVRASNSFDEWTDTQSIHIHIDPPFWRSNIAYGLYILLVLLIVGAVIYNLMHIQGLKHQIHIDELEKENITKMNAEKQRYFSNISHELKTPLTLIIAPLAMLSERFSVDIEVKEKLQIIKRQAQKMLQLVDLAHGIELQDAQLLVPQQSVFNFSAFIKGLTEDFDFLAHYDHKTLLLESPETEVYVHADQSMLEKILNNLLNNAFKHTKRDDQITINYRVHEHLLTVDIIDTGYGIAPEDLPHIFEHFYQGKHKEGANINGTGIGLTFTQKLVDIHKGTIHVTSVLNAGSTFTFSLPIVVETPTEETIETAQSQEAPTQETVLPVLGDADLTSIDISSELAESTVYLVEDNPEMRSFLAEIIGRYFHVKTFINGRECFDAMQNEWPDILVSDIMMPEMEGDVLCQHIKEDMKTSHIPVILLTACSTMDDRVKGLHAGADAFIEKPFYPVHVITRIETLLKNRQQLRERFQIAIPLTQNAETHANAQDAAFLEQLYALFEKNLDNEDIELDNLCPELGINRSMFYQKVKAITNDSPYALLKQYRLKRAAELLETREYNVNEVCMTTGFKSRTHFSRLFKEQYGVSPSKYADSVTNN